MRNYVKTVYNKNKVWYNFIVKRFLAVFTTLLLAGATLGGVTAFASEEETRYPQDSDFIKSFTFTDLADYSVGEGAYAFAENKSVYVCEGSDRTVYSFEKDIKRLDCSEGVFYCYDGESVYSLPDKKIAEYTIAPSQGTIEAEGYDYKLIGSTLNVVDWSDKTVHTLEGSFANLKKYGGVVYAQSANTVYKLTGYTAELIDLSYADYTSTKHISVGECADRLKNYTSLEFVEIDAGTYMTKVDLTSLDGDYFETENTSRTKEKQTALLLCRTGNSAVVAIGDTSYILLGEKAKAPAGKINCFVEPEFDNATVTGSRIYASPYVIIGTSALANASGTIVSITRKLVYEGVLGSAFYEVQYRTEEGSIKTGYVADGFLTEYIIEDNKPPAVVNDPEYSEESNLKTVLIVFAVVVLALAAVGYLAYVSISGKSKKKDGGQKEETTAKQE